MLRALRLSALLAALAVIVAVVAGCGNDVPAGAVAKVNDTEIKKAAFDHWLQAAARQQSQGQPGQPAAPVSIPDPPDFKNCIAAKKTGAATPQGAAPPNDAQLKTQCKQEYDGLKEQTMQFLISAEWLQQEAKKRGVDATPAEVKKTFDEQKKQAFPKEKDYEKFLKDSGRTEADLLFQVKLSVLTNQLQAKVVEGEGDPSAGEIEDYYNENKKRFSTPESRDLLVVLTKKESDAKKALAELNDGKAWKAVVKKYSEDTASKSQGGKLPGVTKGTQEKAFDDAIFKAPKGKVQGPVKTQFGYYDQEPAQVAGAAEGPERLRQGLPGALPRGHGLRRRLQDEPVRQRAEASERAAGPAAGPAPGRPAGQGWRAAAGAAGAGRRPGPGAAAGRTAAGRTAGAGRRPAPAGPAPAGPAGRLAPTARG